MANDTQSSWGSKDDESNNVKKKPASIKELSTPCSAMMDTSGLRWSTREMPLQEEMSSSPSTRSRSEHIDGPMPITTSVKRKSEIVEKQRMPSPSRMSDRGKERLSLGCSGSMTSEMGSGSLDDRRKKLKSEERVKQLMPDAREISRGENQTPSTVGFKKKMDGRTFKSFLVRKRRRDTDSGGVSKPVDDGEDGAENHTSRVDAAAPPSSKCRWNNIAGTHVACSKSLRGQRFGDNPEVGSYELGKKHDKVVNNSADPSSPRPKPKGSTGDEGGDSSLLPEVQTAKSEEGTGLSDVQKPLHVLLNPEVSKLCEILQLSEDVKVMARRFLEYVVDKHQVNREPITILQAFQISLCWIAASLRECEIDKKASLALAKQQLNFGCTEEEANNVHSKLRQLKKRFKVAVNDFASDKHISKGGQVPNRKKKEKVVVKSIKRIQKKFAKQMMKLHLKQEEEIQELNKNWEDESVRFERGHRVELEVIRRIHAKGILLEKLKKKEEEHVKKLKEHEHHRGILLEKLKAQHLAQNNELKQKEKGVLQQVKDEISFELPNFAKKIPDGAPSSEQDAPQSVQDKVVVCAEFVEILSPDVWSNRELDQIEDFDVSVLDPMAVQNDAAVIPTNGDSLEESSFLQPVNTSAQAGSSQQISALHEECSHSPKVMHDGDAKASENQDVLLQVEVAPLHSTSSKSTEIHVGDAEAGEKQDGQQQAEVIPCHATDTGPSVQSNQKEELVVGVEKLQMSPSSESPVDHNQHDVSVASGVERLPSNGLGASQPFENESEASENVNVPQQVERAPLHSLDNVATVQTTNEEPFAGHVKQLQSSKSTGMHGDGEARENQDGLQQFEVLPSHPADTESTVQKNHNEALIEGVKQWQVSPSSDSSGDHTQPDTCAASGVEQLPSEGLGASQPFENELEFRENQNVTHQIEVLPLHSTNNSSTGKANNEETLPESVEELHSSKSSGMQNGDKETRENQAGRQQVEVVPRNLADTGPDVQTNHKEALIGGVQQLQMSPISDSHVDHNRPDVTAASGVEQLRREGWGASQQFENEPAQQLGNEPEALDLPVIQSAEILELPPPIHATDVPLGPILQPAVENDHQPCSQGFMPFQGAETSSQPVVDTAWVPNQEVSLTQSGLHPLEGFGTHLLLNSAPQMASQMVTQPNYGDPLLNELDRLHRENEKTFKIHEDTKLGLKFEFSKELEEAITGIRMKYRDKCQNAESAFLLKKKELDSYTKKVLMNQILANAIKSKCQALLRSQQGVPSNIMQQHIPLSRPAHGPSSVTGSASLPFANHSSPPFSTTPARPPLIAHITPPSGNLRAYGEMRAPAPHLQRFRPSSSMPSISIASVVAQGMLPTQHVQRNLPTASPSVPHVRTTFPSVTHVPMTSPLVPHASSHYDRGRQAEVTGRTREILLEDNNQPVAPPNLLPLQQDLGLNFGSPGLSQFGSSANRGGGVEVNAAGSGTLTDVICLSDED